MKTYRILLLLPFLLLAFGGVITEADTMEQSKPSKAVFFVH